MQEPEVVGEWVRESSLGHGGFGVVTLWRNAMTNDSIAVKKCRWSAHTTSLTEQQKTRWTNEVCMIQQMQNANIVQHKPLPPALLDVIHAYNPSGLPVLSMEYCNRGNLRQVLSEPQNSCGLSERESLYIFADMCNALKYLHSLKIAHRDVKPENIVLQTCSTRPTATLYKLIDLGYGKELGNSCGSFVGTLQYLAPEIFLKRNYNHRVDYWSFGICVFEIVCGVRPFLPTLPPFLCLKEIENKPSGIINIQLDYDGSMVRSDQLLSEHYVSSTFKMNVENWLRIALEFNPDQRHVKDLNLFTHLEQQLAKRILTVFVVYTMKLHSYEIDESTLIADIQESIEIDAKIAKDEQIIIAVNGVEIEGKNRAIKYFDEKYREVMLYVFKKDASFSDCFPNLPHTIQRVFANKNTTFSNGLLSRLYAHVIHLTISQNDQIDVFREALNAIHKLVQIRLKSTQSLISQYNDYVKSITSVINFINQIESHVCLNNYANACAKNSLQNYMFEYRDCVKKIWTICKYGEQFKYEFIRIGEQLNDVRDNDGDISEMFDDFNNYHFLKRAENLYKSVSKQDIKANRETALMVSSILKNRDQLLSNRLLHDYIVSTTNLYDQIHRIFDWYRNSFHCLEYFKGKMEDIYLKKLIAFSESKGAKTNCDNSTTTLMDTRDMLNNIDDSLKEVLLMFKTVLD